MQYLIILSLLLSVISIVLHIRKIDTPIIEVKKDPYKDYRDPNTGLLRARRIDKL